MLEEKAVTPESAPEQTSQEVVTPVETTPTTTASESSTQTTEVSTTPVVNETTDEFGVPYKNRAMEWKRKSEELAEKLPSLVEEKINEAFAKNSQQAQQREYTVAELEQYAMDNPESRPWVEEQKQNLTLKRLTGEIEKKFQATEKVKEANIKKQQSLQYVMQTYPDAFVKNNQGQVAGWNNNHPLTQTIGQLMQDPRFANDPEGLMAASDIAYARFSRGQQPVIQQKQESLKAEVKNLQKQTMIEGGGRQGIQTVAPHRAAIDKLKQTGSFKDATEAVKAIIDAKRKSEE